MKLVVGEIAEYDPKHEGDSFSIPFLVAVKQAMIRAVAPFEVDGLSEINCAATYPACKRGEFVPIIKSTRYLAKKQVLHALLVMTPQAYPLGATMVERQRKHTDEMALLMRLVWDVARAKLSSAGAVAVLDDAYRALTEALATVRVGLTS